MIYLILSLVLACITYVVYKFVAIEGLNGNRVTVYNYIVAASLAIFFSILNKQINIFSYLRNIDISNILTEKSLFGTSLILLTAGPVLGIFFAINLIQTKDSIKKNGVGITSFFKQTGFIGGLFLAIIFLGERPTRIQWIGIVLILVSLYLMINDFRSLKIQYPAILFLLLISGAFVEADNKFFTKYAVTGYQMMFLAVAFVTSFCFSVILFYAKREYSLKAINNKTEIMYGLAIGASNLLQNYFKLRSLEELSAAVVIPTISAGTLILTTVMGFCFFKEKVDKGYVRAMVVAVVSIILLNS